MHMYNFAPKKSHLKLKGHVLCLRPVNYFLEKFSGLNPFITHTKPAKKNDNFPVIYTLNYKEEDIYKKTKFSLTNSQLCLKVLQDMKNKGILFQTMKNNRILIVC